MAELSDEQKDAISHRGRAARALLAVAQRQVDRRGDRDREAEAGVAVVAGEQQQQRGDQRDEHGYAPGDAFEGHLAIVADVMAEAAVRARC